ncbi:hypothetical protein KGA66_00520 [Actinocrinis puniceicyclus]|uniref:Chaperone protein DnaJ n=1 Tax=Actinocrinis puniceicyclus TaxID=977794 RepID=A0A8J8B9Y2_9ACTN|nr:hypothetical protein [Actinocrinis puniceicyclus]
MLDFAVVAGRPCVVVSHAGRSTVLDLSADPGVPPPRWKSARGSVELAVLDGVLVRVLVGPDGPRIARPDADHAEHTDEAAEPAGGTARISRCFTVQDNTLIAAATDEGSLAVWDVVSGALLDSLPAGGSVDSIAATPEGDLLVQAAGRAVLYSYRGSAAATTRVDFDGLGELWPGPEKAQIEGTRDDEVFVPPEGLQSDLDAGGEAAGAETVDGETSGDAGGGTGFGDITDAFFGGASRGPRSRVRRGRDALVRVEVELSEAAFGALRDIQFDTAIACPTCAGGGADPGTPPVTCDLCRGRGEVSHVSRSSLGQVMTSRPCPQCQGYGTLVPALCIACDGVGRVRTRRTLTVKIPPGVEDGTRIQLVGEGEVGPGAGPAGDLTLEIVEQPHPVFRRRGYDLHCTIAVPRRRASLGTRIPLETLDGPVDLDIRPGTKSNQEFTLLGRGIQHRHSPGRGDLVVHIEVHPPKHIDPADEPLILTLARQQHGEQTPGSTAGPGQQGLFSRLKDAFNGN